MSKSGDEPGKCLAFDEFDNLGEDGGAGVHRRGAWKIRQRSSNACHRKSSQTIHYVQFADPTSSVNRPPVMTNQFSHVGLGAANALLNGNGLVCKAMN